MHLQGVPKSHTVFVAFSDGDVPFPLFLHLPECAEQGPGLLSEQKMLFNKMNNLMLIEQELLKSSALSPGHARLDFVSWKLIEDFGAPEDKHSLATMEG